MARRLFGANRDWQQLLYEAREEKKLLFHDLQCWRYRRRKACTGLENGNWILECRQFRNKHEIQSYGKLSGHIRRENEEWW